MAEIRLEHINKTYPHMTTPSVADYNLQIHDKEFIVFVGPSGSGKSTVLRMIAGLEEISSGEFFIDNKLMNDVPPKDRDIAMVFQNYALYPHMSVFDNIAFGLKLRKVPKAEITQRVQDAAKILGIEDYLDRKPADLSGGQRQRVAMGRAIVRDAKILLMDEPLSNLDAKLRVEIRAEITKIHKRIGATTIYVTHDQTEAMTLADRIVIIDHGDIQQVGTPQELYNEPANIFVATFIGMPSMNMISGQFSHDRLTTKDGFTLKIPLGMAKQLTARGYEGKQVVFGIRPEDIHSEQVALDTYPESKVTATVTIAELMGADSMLYTQVGSQQLVARVNARDYNQPGAAIELAININKGHFFDADTTQRIV
ncbi:ABC transporter ATP-binding protein [Leuconostoc lactis]|uniref:ABC transporter ATP-binding protein n=2 Tax=Leuconostoc TaxID=1243 RepID=UPI000A01A518|nr:sn-glycerol-3-phosphate ABC transporter ATP-binding protein UgpC [Leuconostoc lactis]ORI85118.1 sugar ABC transporter ATP-binding protein [Leuconostoc lactis]ORI87478.1 sugar ABC transporter ATP-binding protein [Leuconostoc lactis]